MSAMSVRARIFIGAALTVGAAISVWAFAQAASGLDPHHLWLLLAAVVLASAAQVRFVEGPTPASSYNLSFVVYGFALTALHVEATVVIVIVACLVDWLWHRYPWFIQAFNTAALVLAVFAAGVIIDWTYETRPSGWETPLGLMAGVAAFVLVNHTMVGLVIWLAKGEGPAESGTFGRLTLIIDATLTVIGVAAALLWELSPATAVLVALPVYLLSVALKVPSLERQATTDAKTGLFNARHFQECLSHEIARANRLDRPLCVVIADLDLLRDVNNVYGHLAGDAVIVAVADVLKNAAREYDVVARFGGEEFTLLLTECALSDATRRVEEMRRTIARTPVTVAPGQPPIVVTMSFGVAERRPEGDTAESVLRRADAALYKAKAEGRNRIRVAPVDSACLDVDCVEPAEPGERIGSPQHRVMSEAAAAAVPTYEETAGCESRDAPASGESPTFGLSRQTAAPPRQARPARQSEIVFIAGLAALSLAAMAVALMLRSEPPADLTGLLLFAVICIVAELFSVDVTVHNSSVSTAAAPFVVGALLFGPVAVVPLSLLIAMAAMLKHHSRPSRMVFNASVHMLAGLAALLCANVASFSAAGSPLWLEAVVCIAATVAYYAVTSLLVSVALSLSAGGSAASIWRERFRWLAGTYLVLGLASYALLFGFTREGVAGVSVVLIPLLAVRLIHKEYLGRTSALLAKLRHANADLQERNDEVTRLNEDLFRIISRAVDLRDPDACQHSYNVARYATLIAAELGLDDERIELVRQTALLHDVGKLGVPEPILFKPGPLTVDEYEVVKEHAALSAELLGTSKTCRMLAPIVRHHHERYDGLGYPDGLAGEQLPLEARILAVADAVDAMASDRRYRRDRSTAAIAEELTANSGTQFDPEAVAAFLRVLGREPNACPAPAEGDLSPFSSPEPGAGAGEPHAQATPEQTAPGLRPIPDQKAVPAL